MASPQQSCHEGGREGGISLFTPQGTLYVTGEGRGAMEKANLNLSLSEPGGMPSMGSGALLRAGAPATDRACRGGSALPRV